MWLCVTGHVQGIMAGPLPLLKKGDQPARLVIGLAGLVLVASCATLFFNKSQAIYFSAALIGLWILIGIFVSNMIDW